MTTPQVTVILEVIAALQSSGTRYYLDINPDTPFTFDYDIADVRDISTSNSSGSRSITLPLTDNNKLALGFTFDLATDVNNNQQFNVNNLNKVYVCVDSIQIIDGYLQLQSYVYDDKNNMTAVNCVIIDAAAQFYAYMGQKYLTDIDFSAFSHTYSLYNATASWYSDWTNGYVYPLIDYGENWTDGVISGENAISKFIPFYIESGGSIYSPNEIPLQTGTQCITMNQLYPSTYVKTLWDNIFISNTFSYVSNFCNSDYFESLVVPFCNQNLSATSSASYSFNVGWNEEFNTSFQAAPVAWNSTGGLVIISTDLEFENTLPPYGDPNNLWSGTPSFVFDNPQTNYTYDQLFVLTFSYTFTQFNSDFSLGDYNIYCQFFREYDQTTGTVSAFWQDVFNGVPYQPNNNQFSTLYPQFGELIFTDSPISCNGTNGINNQFVIGSGPTITAGDEQTGKTSSWIAIQTPYLDPIQNQPGSYLFNRLAPGERIRAVIYVMTDQTNWVGEGGAIGPGIVNIDGGEFYNSIDLTVQSDSWLNYNWAVPNNYQQADFVLSIIRLFNLYVEPHPIYPNTLIIEPFINWYNNDSATFSDWTSKIDLSQPITENILSDTQPRQYLFTYKQDNDYYNQQYNALTNQTYGQWTYTNNNLFSNDTQNIDVMFSPTPLALIPGSVNIRTSIIVQNNTPQQQPPPVGNSVNSNIRILQRYPGLLPFDNPYDVVTFCDNNEQMINGSIYYAGQDPNNPNNPVYGLSGWTVPVYSYNGYCYAGMFDNPFNTSIDLAFGQNPDYFIPMSNDVPYGTQSYIENILTGTNSFNTYWNQYVEGLADPNSRLIEVSMYLTLTDILNFSFRNIIYCQIQGNYQYYAINKISGYDPTQISPCQVELLLMNDVTVPFKPQKQNKVIGIGSGVGVVSQLPGVPNWSVVAYNSNVKGLGNLINGSFLTVTGDANQIIGDYTFVVGNGNTVLGNLNTVLGSNNSLEVDTMGVGVIGSGNSLTADSNIQVIGINNTIAASVSNVTLTGSDNTVQSGVQNVNVIGSGVVVTPSMNNQTVFSGTPINYVNCIDAMQDMVTDRFPENSIINVIDAGCDCILGAGTFNIVNCYDAGQDAVL